MLDMSENSDGGNVASDAVSGMGHPEAGLEFRNCSMSKFKPYLITAAVVVVTIIVLNKIKGSLPASVQNLLG